MLEKLADAVKSERSLGIAKRAAFLVAASGLGRNDLTRKIEGVPLASAALSGSVTALNAVMTAAPQLVIESGVERSLGGPPTNSAEVGAHRRALLTANAGVIVVGVLGQRVINHSQRSGALARGGRLAATQLAIGAAASSIVILSDAVLGPLARRRDESSPGTMAVRALTVSAQSRTLRAVAKAITLPTTPSRYAYVGQ
jgi:hypothetical protein